jgi:adenylate cyclase
VKEKFITEEMPSVKVKGKKKPIRIFAVINFAESKQGPKSLARVRMILGNKDPDVSKVNINSNEKKYTIVRNRLTG